MIRVLVAVLVLGGCNPFDQDSWVELEVSAEARLLSPGPVWFSYCAAEIEARGEGIVRPASEGGDSTTVPIPGTIVIRQPSSTARDVCLFAQLTTSDTDAPSCRSCGGVRQVPGANCWLSREVALRIPAEPGGARYFLHFDDDPSARDSAGLTFISAQLVDGGAEQLGPCP